MSPADDVSVSGAGLLGVDRFAVRRSVIDHLQEFLRKAGEAGCEAVGFWVGFVEGTTFYADVAVAPGQQAVKTQDGGVAVVIPGDELHKFGVWLYRQGREIGIQVHSHPRAAYHSETDDQFAVAARAGSLSVVVPDFAAGPFSLADCAVYRLNSAGKWQALAPADVNRLIEVTED